MDLDALADINFEDALKEAIQCDKETKNGKSRGPLHGIPVSIKDELHVAGTVTTIGLAARSDNIILEDGLIVENLRRHGAIPFVKTNVPQLLMIPETENIVFGVTKNPFDVERTPGGSSGGEGALIASRCSPIGIGTDMGGSIRIPSAFCGIYGFKPSSIRTTYKGTE